MADNELKSSELSAQQLMQQFYEDHSRREKQEKRERFKRLNPYVQPRQILFVGSSLMEQFPIYEFLQDFDLPCKIYNRGIGGYTTRELLESMEECVYALEPAYVFINIGTNDLNGPDYCQEELVECYAQILQGIREHLPGAKIFLLAYYPVNTVVGSRIPYMKEILKYRTNARIKEANNAVRDLAERFGAQFLDLNESLTDEQGELKAEYTIEGMHMYANGYKPILDQLLPLLKELA